MKGSPLLSRLVASCSSNMSYRVDILLSSSAICEDMRILKISEVDDAHDRELHVRGANFASELIDVFHPIMMVLETVC